MSDKLTFDFDAVTPRMMIEFRDKTGVSLLSLVGDDGKVDMAAMPDEALAGMIWLAMRMSGRSDATFDDALDTPFSAIEFADDGAGVDPTPASSAA